MIKITANVNSFRSIIKKPFTLLGLVFSTIPRNLGSLNDPRYYTIQDKIFVNYLNGILVNDYKMQFIVIGEYQGEPVWTSSNTSVATVDPNGYVTHVNNGTCDISISLGGQSLTRTLSLSTQTPVSPTTFFELNANSLRNHIWTNINTRTSGKTKSNAVNIFSTQDHANNIYIRNINSWAYGLDLTCFSPWNFDAGYMTAGTLISPRHVLFCKHVDFYPQVPRPDGQPVTIRFINQNNQTITRTLTNIIRVNDSEYPNWNIDFAVGLLDSDVTTQNGQSTGISFAKILPSDWYKYLPNISYYVSSTLNNNYYDTVPVLYIDQEEKNLIGYISRITTQSNGKVGIEIGAPNNPTHAEFFEPLIRFDSGNPIFLIINNQLVILSVATSGGIPGVLATAGTFITGHMSQVNDVMFALGGGYQLTPISLSAFTAF